MDKGTIGLKSVDNGKHGDKGGDKEAATIEKEIEVIRSNLDGLVNELDERRHRLNPVFVARHHPVGLALGGLVVAGAVWAGLAIHNARVRKRNSWLGRARRLRSTLGQLFEKPDVVRAPPGLGKKVLTAAATAAVVVAARRLARQMFKPPA